ncbi:MAG: substrate-binding domain-containing protein [Candidatus Eisenbacteria bacterium]|nr:substrate-binding domain-containing protein [Candidatus Eisenbacteria bacterium]
MSLVARERDAFQSLYPQASIEVASGTSREAIGALFAARCDLAVMTREISAEERAAAVSGKLNLEGYRFARDAVVAVVHPANPVENLTVEELRRIYAGEATRWSQFGGRAEQIVPVAQPPTADLTECMMRKVMEDQPIAVRSVPARSDSEVIDEVRSRPGAIGYVSLAWADRGARALRIASLKGLAYTKPDPETVYRGEYPLTRFFNLYARGSGPRLANGLITFVTSFDGQKSVQESGFVPTAVPVRFVRRSPLRGTH